jgi:hypothetical protein
MPRTTLQLLQILAISVACLADGGGASRAPLLEDGSFLTRVQGTLEPGQGGRGWSFRLRDAFEGEADRVIELLPSGVLEDMVRRRASLSPGQPGRFELSARVTTYRGANAALPLFASTVSQFADRPSRPVLRPPGAARAADAPPVVDEAVPLPPTRSDDAFGIAWVPLHPQSRLAGAAKPSKAPLRADDIEQQLLERVGEAQRSSDLATPDAPASLALGAGSADPLTGRPWLEGDRTVQDRHGVVARDPVTGAWRFVFESSRGELGEREATLLPCAVLERLERMARSGQGPLPVVLSGQVTRFQGRVYMLPLSFATPRTGRLLGR